VFLMRREAEGKGALMGNRPRMDGRTEVFPGGHEHLGGRSAVANRSMRPDIVGVPSPILDDDLGFAQRKKISPSRSSSRSRALMGGRLLNRHKRAMTAGR
jgi:hypothetical protein